MKDLWRQLDARGGIEGLFKAASAVDLDIELVFGLELLCLSGLAVPTLDVGLFLLFNVKILAILEHVLDRLEEFLAHKYTREIAR